MTVLSAAPDRSSPHLALHGWMLAVLLLVFSLALGFASASLARPAFVLGCLAVSLYAWRQGPASHLQAILVLFCFAPFARRFIDLRAGFDEQSLMLVGPLLALMVPVPWLMAPSAPRTRASGPGSPPGLAPIVIVLGCVAYAALISVFQGGWKDAAFGSLKWLPPLLYALVLLRFGERRRLTDAATNMFMLILPIMGLYGVFQYVDPPEWDRNWMKFAVAITAGLPLPYEIRVYSTLNGPASFATFTAVGVLLVALLRPFWLAAIVCAPALLSLLLSQYRTAWIALALGLLFSLLFRGTRQRTSILFVAMMVGATFALAIPKFSDALVERFETFGQGSDDGSFQERLQQYTTLWSQPDSSLVGIGFSANGDAGVAGAMPVDGMLIACWLTMGLVVGPICIAAFLWACGRSIVNAFASGRRDAVALGALGCGALIQIPLASLASAELGFLFWTFFALACLPDPDRGVLS